MSCLVYLFSDYMQTLLSYPFQRNIITVNFRNKDHPKLRPPSLLRPLVSVPKYKGLINETCLLLRLLSTCTNGGLIIGTSLYLYIYIHI